MTRESESHQRSHYDRIQDAYEAHYDDPCSQRYRRRFLYEPLFQGVDLSGKHVLEAMSGSGQVTGFLLERGARVTGLDLSERAIDSFRRRWPECEASRASILDSGLETGGFDAVVVIGGLHHVHPHVDQAVSEIARLLKPGGTFCFGEPHAGSLPDLVRKSWYRRDPLFEEGESAIDLPALEAEHTREFDFIWKRFMGNVAYLLVLNSLVFRLPLPFKPYYAPPLSALEAFLQPLQSARLSCFALCRWRRR